MIYVIQFFSFSCRRSFLRNINLFLETLLKMLGDIKKIQTNNCKDRECFCDPDKLLIWDNDVKKCICDADKNLIWDDASDFCICDPNKLLEWDGETCACNKDKDLIWDSELDTCVCDPDKLLDWDGEACSCDASKVRRAKTLTDTSENVQM